MVGERLMFQAEFQNLHHVFEVTIRNRTIEAGLLAWKICLVDPYETFLDHIQTFDE